MYSNNIILDITKLKRYISTRNDLTIEKKALIKEVINDFVSKEEKKT